MAKLGFVVVAIVVIAVGGYFAYTQFVPKTVSVSLLAAEYAFSDGKQTNPTITVKAGDTVKVIVKNVGGLKHEFMVVDDLNASIADVARGRHPMPAFGDMITLEPREEKTTNFTPTRPGTIYYVCLVETPEIHAKLGMWGKFVVEK